VAIAGRGIQGTTVISGAAQTLNDLGRNTLQDAATQGPIVVTAQPSPYYKLPSQNLGPVYRSTLVDPPVLTTQGPIVVTSPGPAQYYRQSGWGTPSSDQNLGPIYRSTLFDPPVLTTAGPIVATGPVPKSWLATNTPFVGQTPQVPPPPPAIATPGPVIATSLVPKGWTATNPAFLSQAPQAPLAVTTPEPTIVTAPVPKSWLATNTPFIGATPPATLVTPDPLIVVTAVPKAWTTTNHPSLLRAPAAPPSGPTTVPIVVTGPRGPRFLFEQAFVGSGTGVVPPDVRTPLHLSGTLTDTNLLGGTVTGLLLGGNIVNALQLGGTVAQIVLGGTALVIDPGLGGTAITADPVDSTLVEWTMQEVDIVLAEFNDETLNLALTVGQPPNPLNITGLELDMFLKPTSGVADGSAGVVKLSTITGEIVITNPTGGLATVSITNVDLTNPTAFTFYRVDRIDGTGKRNTAIFGKVSITPL
jgi:hypothetical protein